MLSLPHDFVETLWSKYESAQKDGSLVFNGDAATHETLTSVINGKSYNFHLTELHSLQKRPEKGSVDSNPFAKPEPELTILPTFGENGEFRVVFNKFPVVPGHFMLVTKEFRSQDTPLAPNELVATFSLLKELEKNDPARQWFAFYNCGPQSGASQPHKHVQFMSLPEGYEPFAQKLAATSEHFVPNIDLEPLQDADLPFAHFVAPLPAEYGDDIDETLAMTFVSLLQRTLNVLKGNECNHISYNFCATTKYMMLAPRSVGKYEDIGINSCGMFGLVLCKDDQVVRVVKERGFENILLAIGFPNTSGEKSDQYHY